LSTTLPHTDVARIADSEIFIGDAVTIVVEIITGLFTRLTQYGVADGPAVFGTDKNTIGLANPVSGLAGLTESQLFVGDIITVFVEPVAGLRLDEAGGTHAVGAQIARWVFGTLLVTVTGGAAPFHTAIAVGMDRTFVIRRTIAATSVDADLTGKALGIDVTVLGRRNAAASLAGVVRWTVLYDGTLGRMTQCIEANLPRVTLTVDRTGHSRRATAL